MFKCLKKKKTSNLSITKLKPEIHTLTWSRYVLQVRLKRILEACIIHPRCTRSFEIRVRKSTKHALDRIWNVLHMRLAKQNKKKPTVGFVDLYSRLMQHQKISWKGVEIKIAVIIKWCAERCWQPTLLHRSPSLIFSISSYAAPFYHAAVSSD